MKEYAIFDLDGTLIDSFDCICRNINKTLAYFDCPICTDSQFEIFRNKDLSELLSYSVETTNGKVSMSLFKSVFDKMHYEDCLDGVTIIPKTKRLLDDAIQKGIGIIVLTNKRQEIAEKICNALFPIRPIIIGRKNSNAIKKANVIKLKLCEKQIDTNSCVAYFGNSQTDMILSRNLKIIYKEIDLI